MYRDIFYSNATRWIAWELTVYFPEPDHRVDYVIEAVYMRPDGSIMHRLTIDSYAPEGWGTRQDYRSLGWREPSNWIPGEYRVEISVDGQNAASRNFSVVDQEIPVSGEFPVLRGGLSWGRDPLASDERNGLYALAGLLAADVNIGTTVASFPWAQGILTSDNLQTLQVLNIIAGVDLKLAKDLASREWFVDGITPAEAEAEALRAVGAIAYQDLALAKQVAGMGFFGSAPRERDAYALLSLSELLDQPDDLRSLTRQPWFVDGLTAAETALLSVLGIVSERAHLQFEGLLESHHIETATVEAPLGGDIQLFAVRRTPFPQDDNTLQLMRKRSLVLKSLWVQHSPKTT